MKVLIIGLGSIAKKHIAALKKRYFDIAIYALRHSRSGPNIDGVENIYEIGDIGKHSFDFVIVSNQTSKHFEVLQTIKDLKIPLFIEKPLFAELSPENEKLVAFLSERSIVTYVACNLRFLPCLVQVKKLIVGKRLNEVNVYCGSYLPDWRPNIDFREVYSANKELGGGVHIDLIHELDYLYWMFGEPTNTVSHFANKSSLKISAFDYANYLWEYSDFNISVILNYYRRDAKRSLEIVCEDETYLVDLLKNKIYQDSNLIFESDQGINDTYLLQMDYFINEILGNNVTFNPVKEAYKILSICLKD
jgi:predicted dehydrogenase